MSRPQFMIRAYSRMAESALPTLFHEHKLNIKDALKSQNASMHAFQNRLLEEKWMLRKSMGMYLENTKKPIVSQQRPKITLCSGMSLGSPKRLNLVAQVIKGLSIEDAMLQMSFCKKKGAQKILYTLVRLRSKAEAQGLPIDRLKIAYCTVGRGRITKEIDIKGRGRHGIIKHYQSQATITLQEPDYETLFKRRFKIPRTCFSKGLYFNIDY